MDIREFIEQRITEDERIAQFAIPALGEAWTPMYGEASVIRVNVDDHAKRHDPARVLREVAAKRAIVALIERIEAMEDRIDGEWPIGWPTDYPSMELLPLLAAPYVDHPDFDPAWRING